MRLYTFTVAGGPPRLGAEQAGGLVDLGAAYRALPDGPESGGAVAATAFDDLLELLRAGTPALDAARLVLAFVAGQPGLPGLRYAFDEVRLRAPLRPGKILCSGINYRSHLVENPSGKLPESPFFFAKLPNAVVGPGEPIVHPRATRQLDYEVELAVVIGRRMRRLPAAAAMEHVAGYTILHDVSARDVQFKDNQITLGKNFDSFAPLGPCVVTADELPEPHRLRLRTLLNGEVVQDGSTSDWVFPLPELLAALAAVMTLEPGDVVTTGTPAGVGVFRRPPRFLRPGDRVALEVEGIGRLENYVVAEDD